jgi:hypothetical protein
MNTPRNGRTMTKMIHRAFENPDVSCRRNTSAKMVISNQNQITHAKITSIVQKTSRNG